MHKKKNKAYVLCFEHKNCLQLKCPAYNNKYDKCWKLPTTHNMNTGNIKSFEEREKCKACDYFKYRHK